MALDLTEVRRHLRESWLKDIAKSREFQIKLEREKAVGPMARQRLSSSTQRGIAGAGEEGAMGREVHRGKVTRDIARESEAGRESRFGRLGGETRARFGPGGLEEQKMTSRQEFLGNIMEMFKKTKGKKKVLPTIVATPYERALEALSVIEDLGILQ